MIGKWERGELLRIFINENSRHAGKSLCRAIVEKALQSHLAGATVLKSPMGFGSRQIVHSALMFESSGGDMPLVIEIVDTEGKIDAFLPLLDEMMTDGIVTREPVDVIRYGSDCSA